MVIKKETKEDVFANFRHLDDNAVPDNEETLNRVVENAMLLHGNVSAAPAANGTNRSSKIFDDGVFAEFKLKLEQETEGKIERQRQLRDEERRRKISKEKSLRNRIWKSVRFAIDSDSYSNSDSDSDESIIHGRPQQHDHHNHRRHHPNTNSSRRSWRTSRRSQRFDVHHGYHEHNNTRHEHPETNGTIGNKKHSFRKRSEKRKHLSIQKEDSYNSDYDLERGGDEAFSYEKNYFSNDENEDSDDSSDNDDDNDSAIDKEEYDSVITRSKTGMPIGGMSIRSTRRTNNSDDDDDNNTERDEKYHWVSPHSSDLVFSEFDLDAIVKDYEKLQRNLDFGINDKQSELCRYRDHRVDEDDEGDENELKITAHYRNLRNLWVEYFPRTNAILFKVFVPLMFIVFFSIFLGDFLGKFEMKNEIEQNNQIMRDKHELEKYPYEETLYFMFGLPILCFDYYLEKEGTEEIKHDSNYNWTAIVEDTSAKEFTNETDAFSLSFNSSMLNLSELLGYELPPIYTKESYNATYDGDSNMELTLGEIKTYMAMCEEAGADIVSRFIDFSARRMVMEAVGTMSFHWMRCWNTTELGDVNPFRPNKDQLQATTQQDEFYDKNWRENQKFLYEQYLSEANCSDIACRNAALRQSVENANGSEMCDINKGASAWFWFVFMTTVGYGNQSPETTHGRLLVGCLGWIIIIIWAVVLYVAGKILGIVIDDVFRKCNCRIMTGDIPSVIVWGAVSGLWIVAVGEIYRYWLNYTEDPHHYDWAMFVQNDAGDISTGDAYWFSYISLLTVGLGDFYLDSEGFFYYDLMMWTGCFLAGFTFLSTFLGQVADVITNVFPDNGDSLKEQLMNTNLVKRKDVQFKKENEKGIEKLEKLVEVMDDDDKELVAQRVTRIRVKKNLLIHLLYQTKSEIEYYRKRGERYENLSYSKVCQEENMLNEVLSNTVKEREKLETYRRTEVCSAPPPGSARARSYFEDGTRVDGVGEKLHLRSGKKSVKKRIKASTYL